MAALANSGVPTVNPALNVKQQLALAILGGQGTATQMLRERRKNLTTASQPKGMSASTTDMEVLIKLVCVIVESYSVCLYIFDCICLPIMFMGVLPETHTVPPSVKACFWKTFVSYVIIHHHFLS